jgi:hypothetical protein
MQKENPSRRIVVVAVGTRRVARCGLSHREETQSGSQAVILFGANIPRRLLHAYSGGRTFDARWFDAAHDGRRRLEFIKNNS